MLSTAAAPPLFVDGTRETMKAGVKSHTGERPGVYLMRSPTGEIIYVGKSKKLRTRLLSYFRAEYPSQKGARILREAASIEWSYVPSEFAALLEELRCIKRYRPRFNVAMKRDDRNYAFVKMTRGKAPRLLVVRGAGADERATYYGPFGGATRLRDALRELSDALGLRDCSLDGHMRFADQQELIANPARTPGCLRYEVGKCLGPCVAAVMEHQYGERVAQARAFLEGGDATTVEVLRSAMQRASDSMEFERAAALRDKAARLDGLLDLFSRLRFGVEGITFAYAVRGHGGEDRVYLIRRGRVRGELPWPRSAAEIGAVGELAERLRDPTERSNAIPGHEVDELLLLTSWFRTRGAELERTAPLDDVTPLFSR